MSQAQVRHMGMFFVALHSASPSGEFNLSVPVGWANRLFWLGSGCWLIVMAWQALKRGQTDGIST